ncbi:MAG: hypothetical protein EBR73_13295, partial [Rhodobacteraceae bacterium]|nr:hypothetical protein [Paracoccaceae bacterium]
QCHRYYGSASSGRTKSCQTACHLGLTEILVPLCVAGLQVCLALPE